MQADTTTTDAVGAGAGKPPRSFYIIAVLALAWNLIGLAMFVLQGITSPAEMGETPEQVAFYQQMPDWVMTAFAVATVTGVAACIMLLIRNKQAVPLFTVSLAAVLVQNAYNFFFADALGVFGTAAVALPVLVIATGIAMLLYALRALKRGWL